MKTITIIDTFGFLFRSYFALPPLKSQSGFPTGLLTGFVNFVANLSREHESDYLLFALDSPGPTFRSLLDPAYKAHRPEVPEELKRQLPIAIQWIEKMGFKQLSIEGYEADDIIASMTRCAKEMGVRVRIISHDKDLHQLIDDGRVVLYDPIKKIEIDERKCIEKYGVAPKEFRDYQALVGDSADNIPGVRGIGPKTAVKLIKEFKTIEGIYKNIDKVTPERARNLLKEHKEDAFLSKHLVTLKDDLFKVCSLEEFKIGEVNPVLKIADELIDYDIRSVLERVKRAPLASKEQKKEAVQQDFEAVLLDSEEELLKVIEALSEDALVALDTETDGLDARSARIVGFSFAADEKRGYYVPIAHSYLGVGNQVSKEKAKIALEKLLQKRIIGQNLKFDLAVLYGNFGFSEVVLHADTMILAWLADPEGSVGLDHLALRYLGHKMISFKETVKKGENFGSVSLESAAQYAAEDAVMTYRLYFALLDELKAKKSSHLLDEAKAVEYPFVNTLIWMENAGIRVDTAFFDSLGVKTKEAIAKLSKKIYELSGVEFNINSTQQLGEVLFERLGLPALKKTKTGYSTDAAVLIQLAKNHPVVEAILEYRELFKLLTTYIEPLSKLARQDKEGRVYTTFLQTGTATGRLSSKNPNLQNIPIKTEVGREIRNGFVAAPGKVLVGLDYSQIELRLLAHFSEDPVLVESFRNDRDIHLETAVKLFGANEAPRMRGVAKTVNFGLLYGMGPKKLSQTLGIGTKEAKEIIESYFRAFPTVKAYLSSIERYALEHGFVQTLLKRRRYFDFAGATDVQKAGYLREAVNTVFQGSAADLIKMAMNTIKQEMSPFGSEVKMLLQIHDELIFELSAAEASQIGQRLKEIMEGIYPLRVPLKTSMSIAGRWGELK